MRVFLPLLPLSLLALPASADVTADEVWADWQAITAGYGVTLSAEGQTREGDSLTLESVRKAWTAADGSTAIAKIAEITLTETDGTVVGTLGAPVDFEIRQRSVEMGSTLTNGTMEFGKGTILATGTPGAIRYTYDYPSVAFEFTSVGMGPTGPNTDAGSGTLTDVLAHSHTPVKTGAPLDMDLSIGTIDYLSTASAAGTQAKAEGSLENIAVAFSLPEQSDPAAPPQFDLTWTQGAAVQDMAVTGADGSFASHIETQSGKGQVRHRDGGFDWSVLGEGTALEAVVQSLPMPIRLALPHIASTGTFRTDTTPAPFEATVTLDGLTVNPEIWNIFDPEAHINRAPARLDVDLAGLAAVPTVDNPTPGKTQLTVRKAELTAGGATLLATGDLSVDPAAPVVAPEGQLQLTLDGGLALLDSLVQAQITPAQQLMGVQLMIGMLTVQDGTADRLKSDIEFGPGQQVFINGTQMR